MQRIGAFASIIAVAAMTALVPNLARAAQPAAPMCVDSSIAGEAPPDEGKDPGACSQARAARQIFGAGNEAALLEAEADTDVTHYLLDLEVIPEYSGSTVTAVRVEGVNAIDLVPTVNGLTTFTIDLRSNLTVTAVTGDVASWTRVGHTVEVTLDRSYDVGEAIQVVVDYEGYPQSAAFGAFRWWTRNGDLFVATLSEPFYARYWWPAKDALNDKATMQMHVTVPSEFVALSNGLEVGTEALSGSRTRFLWHETHPMIPYLASLAIGPYGRYDLQYDYDDGGMPASMPVPCYVYPDHFNPGLGEPLPIYKAGCDEMLGMLETLIGIFGTYPWIDEKYGVVETGGTGGLSSSMEHQTLSSMWKVDGYSDIMTHELAHQWWGDEITCETWYDIWLNEGFASYSEALYREFRTGGSIHLYWSRMFSRRPSNPDAQVYRTSIGSTGSIFSTNDIYNKGAWVLHMLRHVMGDEAFFAALTYYRAYFANDSTTTAEFVEAFSGSFGADLGWFADQWVMNPGSPDYEWNYVSENIDGQDVLKLSIWQRQDLDGYGSFTMPIDIRVTTASGPVVHKVWNDDWNEYYVLPLDGPAITVEFDEDGGVSTRPWILADSVAQVATPLAPPPVLLRADVETTPAGAATVTLAFSEDIGSFDAGDLALTGGSSGAQTPDFVSYDAGTRTATITWSGLAIDNYTLEVFDSGISANGKLLDGEVADTDWWDDTLYPSGDGQPGGNALVPFTLGAQAIPSTNSPTRLALFLLLTLTTTALLRR